MASKNLTSAAKNGDLEGVKRFLATTKKANELTNAMNYAAGYNHMEVFEYLRAQGITCTNGAMDFAAGNGHLQMVQHLHTLGLKGSLISMNAAAEGGYLEVVQYLFENGYRCTFDATSKAAKNGHLHILQYLHSKELDYFPPVSQEDKDCCGDVAMTWAAMNGHMAVFKYLHSIGKTYLVWAIAAAARNGHLEMVKYIHSLDPTWDFPPAYHDALKNNRTEVVEFLNSVGKGTKRYTGPFGPTSKSTFQILQDMGPQGQEYLQKYLATKV